jgi:hypothetical protein
VGEDQSLHGPGGGVVVGPRSVSGQVKLPFRLHPI